MNNLGWVLGFPLKLALGVLAIGIGSSACGGSAPKPETATYVPEVSSNYGEATPEVHKRGSGKLIVVVGPAGGTLELDNGARLLIPQGSLSEPVEVTFAEGSRTTAFSNHDYERPLGPTLEIACDSTLQSPFELSIPDTKLPEGFSEKDLALGVEAPASTQRAIEGQAVQTRWDYLEASAKAGRAVASLVQVPGYRVQFLVSKAE
ncbi:MAG: hypothetical protein JWN48_3712 [Myxococcaceae bacterium]|nr:hypothetical protein [Myxococcaceae bacterium]